MSISSIARSGIEASFRRLDVSASNVANELSFGAIPDENGKVPPGTPRAYVPLQLVQAESAGGGVRTSVVAVTPSTIATFDPNAPFSNADGLVAAPNVDLAQEFASQLIAKYSLAANVKVMQTNDQMEKALLDVKA
jgi:flagellar basal-body rod protein FlgC